MKSIILLLATFSTSAYSQYGGYGNGYTIQNDSLNKDQVNVKYDNGDSYRIQKDILGNGYTIQNTNTYDRNYGQKVRCRETLGGKTRCD